MYQIDPLKSPSRLEFSIEEPTTSVELDFRNKIQDLSSCYDIGYHGHYFTRLDGRWRMTFDHASIASQLVGECQLLADAGFRPLAYSGGWWYMAPHLARLIQSFGFRIDTTINDLRRDSFNRKQPYSRTLLGQPFKLERDVIEVPATRSVLSLLSVLVSGGGAKKIVVFSLHDYNLLVNSIRDAYLRTVRKLVRNDRIIGMSELLSLRPSTAVA